MTPRLLSEGWVTLVSVEHGRFEGVGLQGVSHSVALSTPPLAWSPGKRRRGRRGRLDDSVSPPPPPGRVRDRLEQGRGLTYSGSLPLTKQVPVCRPVVSTLVSGLPDRSLRPVTPTTPRVTLRRLSWVSPRPGRTPPLRSARPPGLLQQVDPGTDGGFETANDPDTILRRPSLSPP